MIIKVGALAWAGAASILEPNRTSPDLSETDLTHFDPTVKDYASSSHLRGSLGGSTNT